MNRLLLSVLVGSVATSAYCQSALAAVEAADKGDPAAAVAAWLPLAEKGDAEAEFNLGQAYLYGRGVPVNVAQGRHWIGRAASKGQVDAQATLGLLLYRDGDVESAIRWLSAAAEVGEPRALMIMGSAFYLGEGVPKDPVKGYAYTSRSAAKGLQPARARLAQMEKEMPLEQRQKGFKLAMQMAGDKAQWPAAPLKQIAAPAPNQQEQAKQIAAAAPRQDTPAKLVAAPPEVKPTKLAAVGRQANLARHRARSLPPMTSPAGSFWRIQLGAFSKRNSAEQLYKSVSRKLLGRQAHYIPVKSVVRLQVGPFADRAAASAECAKLAPQPCFPVAVNRP